MDWPNPANTIATDLYNELYESDLPGRGRRTVSYSGRVFAHGKHVYHAYEHIKLEKISAQIVQLLVT